MSFGMILLIGYLVTSFLVAIAFYTACVMAAWVDEAEQKRAVARLRKRQMVINALKATRPTQHLQPHLV